MRFFCDQTNITTLYKHISKYTNKSLIGDGSTEMFKPRQTNKVIELLCLA